MIPKGRVVYSVKELRDYLDEVEDQWTEQDTKYLGKFEHQGLRIPYFSDEGEMEGYAALAIDYPLFATGFFVLDRPKEEGQ